MVGADGGETRWIDTPDDPANSYLATLDWIDAEHGCDPAIESPPEPKRLSPGRCRDRRGSPASSAISRTHGWMSQDAVVWIDNGRSFLWSSERDGWRHVYRVPKEGGNPTLITAFDGDVIDVAGADDRELYFLASPSNATQRYSVSRPARRFRGAAAGDTCRSAG